MSEFFMDWVHLPLAAWATSTVLMYTAIASAVASTAMGVSSAKQQGKATQKAMDYNAQLAEQQAKTEAASARQRANAQRREGERALARNRALYAAAGVSASAGTPLLVEAEQASEYEYAALEAEVFGERTASRLNSQAASDRMAGATARVQGRMAATGSILQGVSSVASIWGGSKGGKAAGGGKSAAGLN